MGEGDGADDRGPITSAAMALDVSDLIIEIRKFLAGRGGGDDPALGTLAARTLELAELLQHQGEEINELKVRLDLRSR
jgi:hypothetical protein